MPIIKSAKKRVKVATKATIRNSKTKRSLKTAIKAFGKALTATDKKKAVKALDKVQSELDKAAKKGIMHKNKAARKKSQAARNARAAGVPSGVKNDKVKATPVKKAPAKKTPVKKAPAKKAAPAKKPAAKKAPAKKK
ncbi:30S ribosomal protein S20 [Candidatus Saccharibacteria bacterium]|nr:MAG: 30S ribosomal protein S20 [Candidatus Saccharibacteria bacterium]